MGECLSESREIASFLEPSIMCCSSGIRVDASQIFVRTALSDLIFSGLISSQDCFCMWLASCLSVVADLSLCVSHDFHRG